MDATVKQRRYRYRRQQARKGLCAYCPSPLFTQDIHACLRHYVFYMLRKKGLTKGVLPPFQKRKREKLMAFITGRYAAVRAGYLVPGDHEQRIKDVLGVRLRLHISWGGVRGADKIAEIVRNIDNKALSERRKEQNDPSS